ncbi:MAG: alpha/beta hydrolase, partial [Proteobacteria bacterium]|nr:alpha/beta hydrolase [Pseudomonadota bacterium]
RSFETAENNPWPRVEQLSCPTLIMYGASHSTCNPSGVKKYCELQPDTEVFEVEGTGHFLPMEKSELVAEKILGMINRIESS